MSLCWDCDEEITFRYFDGAIRPIHESGYCGEYRRKAIPVKCRKCSQMVYYVEHNGGSVWFDELGPPWRKHPCFEPNCAKAANHQTHQQGTLASCYDNQGRKRSDLVDGIANKPQSKLEQSHKTDALVVRVNSKVRSVQSGGKQHPKFRRNTAKAQREAARVKEHLETLETHKRPPVPPVHPYSGAALLHHAESVGGTVTPPNTAIPSTTTIVLDKQGRRRCEFCRARVRPNNYGRHLAKEHGK